MRVAWLVLSLSLCACTSSESVQCGDLTCPSGSTCTNDGRCIPAGCGDGTVGELEQCDPMATAERCVDYAYYGLTPVGCTETCELDFTPCFGTCGDQMTNGPESCDGIPQAGLTCSDFGFDVGKLACSSACSPSFELCSNIGWKPAAGGATNQLNAAWVAAINDIPFGFAVGDNGTILRFANGAWVPMASPTTANLYAVTGTAEGVIAVGAGGVVLRLQLATGVWDLATVTAHDLHAVAGTDASDILAVGDAGTILHFDGTSWTPQTSGTTASLRGVWVGASNAFVVGASGTLLRSAPGNAWNAVDPAIVFGGGGPYPQLNSVFAIGGEVFVAGNTTTMLRFTTTWELLPLPANATGFNALTVWGSSKTDIYFGGTSGQILHWDGREMVTQPTHTTRSIGQIHGIDASRIVAATRSGEVLELGGLVLREDAPPGAMQIRAVYMDGDNTYAVGTGGSVFRHDRTGWTTIPFTLMEVPAFSQVWASGTDLYLAGVFPGGVYHKAGAADFVRETTLQTTGVWGLTAPVLRVVAVGLDATVTVGAISEYTIATGWTTATIPAGTPILRAVWASSDGHWFAVGDGGVILQKTPTGVWTAQPSGVTVGLAAVWGTSATDVFAAGALGTILHWNGTVWRAMYTGTANGFGAVAGTTPSDVFAVGSNGSVYHFDGISWSPMTPLGIEVLGVATDGPRTIFGGSLANVGSIFWLTRAIEANETRCQDPWDNDGNDGTNCDDPNCANALVCVRGGACETIERIDCDTQQVAMSSFTGIARIDDFPCLDHSTPGPEASFRFNAELSGPVTVTIDEPTGLLDLVVLDAEAGACQLASCRPATRGDGASTITFDATAGSQYYVMVDGPVSTAADFTLSVSCP